ncbi:chemotaxis protein CheA [Methylobacter sp.]|uniref:chemotaxis protein CheA n=1 Tax=Methylobacter sp. TaxID=2051955 RepID=UPI002FDD7835
MSLTDSTQSGASDSSETLAANTQGVFLRVQADKVDRLMDLVGELSLGVSEVIHSPDLVGLELSEFEKSAHRLRMIVREIQDAAAELRQVSVGDVFRRMRRMVRELERQTGKKIELAMVGEDTEIDKVVADRLYEPLVHVLRNSADHGLESPAERIAVGKPETGRITLIAAQLGGDIQITVADDGRGLHREKILARAKERGLVGVNEEPEDSNLWKVIFQPGFSTAETVTNLSGRGVGMDVLNATMKDLRGRIAVDSKAGKGTRVNLSIPLSLAFLDSLVMRIGRRLYATPVDAVSEVFRPESGQISAVSAGNGAEMIQVREHMVPVCRLQRFYGEDCRTLEPLDTLIIVVFKTSFGQIGLPVDEMYDQQQVVMKPLQGQLGSIRASLGCALLGTGEIAVVLDCEELARRSRP